jgi:hypothetical protein
MNKDNIKISHPELGNKIIFKDKTEYFRMPNGELRRISPRAFEIRKGK